MQINHFVGIDISKRTLDITVIVDGQVLYYDQVINDLKHIKPACTKLLQQLKATYADTVFCMEHTGIYNLPLVKYLHTREAKIWLESGVHIKKSLGVARGKNDKVDSSRIAMFAFTNRHKVKLWKAPRPVVEKINALLGQRARMIKAKKQLKTAYQEQKIFVTKEISKSIHKYTSKTVAVLDRQLEAIEKEIMDLIKADEQLFKLYRIITSVDGIGFVTATYIIMTTNEFRSISDPKKYACYSGVAPFEHTSGTSIRGKTRVSQMANKNLKTLLHMAAMSAIQIPGDMQEYYLRKVAEGKNKMSVINAVRSKLILRVFACVKYERFYQKKYTYALVKS